MTLPRIQPVVIADVRRDRLPKIPVAVVSYGGSGISPWVGMVSAIGAGMRSSPTHILLLEDDAEPCVGFLDIARLAVASRPYDAVSFFCTEQQAGNEVRIAREHGLSWALVSARPVGGVALCLPVGMAQRFVSYFTASNDADFCRAYSDSAGAGDVRLWHYLTRVCGQALCVSAWSLVGHGCPHSSESLAQLGHHGSRYAFRPVAGVAGCGVGGEEPIEADKIDWSSGADIDSRSAI